MSVETTQRLWSGSLSRKVRKSGILDEVRDRKYYKKPSIVKNEQKEEGKKLLNKLNQKEKELYNYSNLSKKRYNRRKNSMSFRKGAHTGRAESKDNTSYHSAYRAGIGNVGSYRCRYPHVTGQVLRSQVEALWDTIPFGVKAHYGG